MMTKKIAGDLYGNGFMLQDKEGVNHSIIGVYEIIEPDVNCWSDGLKLMNNRWPGLRPLISFDKIGTDYHILARTLDFTKEIPFEGKMIDPYLTLLAYRKTELDYEIIVDMYKNDFDTSRLELLSHKVVFVMQTLHFAIGLPEGSWIPVTENNNPYMK